MGVPRDKKRDMKNSGVRISKSKAKIKEVCGDKSMTERAFKYRNLESSESGISCYNADKVNGSGCHNHRVSLEVEIFTLI